MGIMEQQPGYQALVDQYRRGNEALGYTYDAGGRIHPPGTSNGFASTLSSLLGGGSAANAFGAVPQVDTSNRFESGLSDAETRLRNLLDNPDSIQQSAAYKFRVKQGEESINRQLGAKGLLNSGNRLMELTKYGQDMGSQEYDAQAGRLGSLLGNYTTGYTADKNANTSRYAAQAGAWNAAQGNADTNRYRMSSLAWDMNKPQVIGGSRSGTPTATYSPNGFTNTVDNGKYPLSPWDSIYNNPAYGNGGSY